MKRAYYETVEAGGFKILLGYTKDAVVVASFDMGEKSEKQFFNFLDKHFDDYKLNEGTSIFGEIVEKYLKKESESLDVPVELIGTEFNVRAWREIMKVPYGHVKTYKEIAEAVDCPKGFRAVGNANNKNPIVLIVP